jgi:hypothetical protein
VVVYVAGFGLILTAVWYGYAKRHYFGPNVSFHTYHIGCDLGSASWRVR